MALLEVGGLTVRRGTRTILDEFGLKIDSGECVILSGENGSGKSTLIESIVGVLPIESGTVMLAKPFGLTLQSGGMNGDETVEERIGYASKCGGVTDAEDLLAEWNLQHRLKDRICHLSGGLYRRLAVLQGLMPAYGSENRICILDEPSEGLDEESVKILVTHISSLRARGNSFLIATHDPRLQGCATTFINLEHGNSNSTPSEESAEIPTLPNTEPQLALSKWSANLDKRTMWPLLSRGIPLVASALVLYVMLGDGMGSMILIPAFLASIPPLSSLHHGKDARSGDWWRAMGGRLFAMDSVSILLILVAPILTVTVFDSTQQESLGMINWIMVGIPFVAIYLASGSIYELAYKMPRSQAQYVPLLSLILIWPLLIASESVEQCTVSGVCDDLGMSIFFATAIPLIISFGLPILHPRTASD